MVSYNSRTDDISIDGKRVSSQRAKQIKNSLEQELSLREIYLNSELSKYNISVTNRTIKILCDTSYETRGDVIVKIGFALENENIDKLFTNNIITWLNKWDTHGEFLIFETNVKEIFEKSNVKFTGFNVKYANNDILKEFREEIELFVK